MDFVPISPTFDQDVPLVLAPEATLPVVAEPEPRIPKDTIRESLKASTLDGVFATVFANTTGGVLLSNLLLELQSSPWAIGLLSSIPMLANLLQPLGAFLGDRTTSRHWYCLWIYGPSRLLWVLLLAAIAIASWYPIPSPYLVGLTLSVVMISHFLGALGSASWLSWLAALVPRRLRGRYFGIRNSAASLANLISVPLLGLIVSHWWGGSVQGYAVVLGLGIVAGLISLGFQYFMVDINPQIQQAIAAKSPPPDPLLPLTPQPQNGTETEGTIWRDFNFLRFLLYFASWMFATNLCAPFFNVYLLDDLALDISWVTFYTSLSAGANLVMLIVWGRVADRLGNRPLLLLVGVVVAITPLLWVGTGSDPLSVWLWLPLLHLLGGGTWAAIDLCSNNLQLGVAPRHNQASYFAIAAATAGVSGALGTTVGGFLAELTQYGGLLGLFALSSMVRLLALLPLVFVREQRARSLRQMTRRLLFGEQGHSGGT